jgi:phosphohistidine phosphatase SixA
VHLQALLALLLSLLLSACGGLAPPEPEGPLTGDALVAALQDGGLVLYVRHTETTDDGVDDLAAPGSCAGQRMLTEAGQQQARDLGAALRQLDVPIGLVLASPLCRTVETAELAFGRAEPSRALLPEVEDRQETRDLLAQVPDDGTNTVLVGHVTTLREAAGAEPREGGTVVFRPSGAGDFLVVGEVAPGGWQRLAASR